MPYSPGWRTTTSNIQIRGMMARTKFCPIPMRDLGPCGKRVRRGLMCSAHYERNRMGRSMESPFYRNPKSHTLPPCNIKMDSGFSCGKEHYAKGMCDFHYQRSRADIDLGVPRIRGRYKNEVCYLPHCDRPAECMGLCGAHYSRKQLGKDLDVVVKGRPKNLPIGTKRIDSEGYVSICIDSKDPVSNGKRWIQEHRYVMSKSIGRALEPNENVHHLNGIRSDNRLENLELWKVTQPVGQRVSDLIRFANEIIKEYGTDPFLYDKDGEVGTIRN